MRTTPQTTEAQEKHSNKIGLIYELNAKHKFRKANHSETVQGVTLAETLIGQKLAAVENIAALDAHTQCTVWVNGDPIEGVHFMVPLTKEGEIAVRGGTFNPSAPSLSHCASPEENYAGVYVGAYAGATREVRKNIMQGAAEIRFLCFGALPCFARASTEDGARSMSSLGFKPVIGDTNDLWCQETLMPASGGLPS